jgi:hypothetical protein
MNKWRIAFVVVVALALAGGAWAQSPALKSSMVGKGHDLRATYGSASFTLCSFCHVAHKAGPTPTGPGELLWNHTLSTATYSVYTSSTLKATDVTSLTGLTTTSNLCLSCHDGTVAVNQFYVPITNSSFTGTIPEGTSFINSAQQIADLSKTHPVNFTYDATLAGKANLRVPAATHSVDGNYLIPLPGGKMQCSTCHDPHNGNSGIFTRPFPTNPTSSFCVYCHQ